MREEYGWKVYQDGNIKLWFCGYIYGISIEDLLTKLEHINKGNTENKIIFDWVNSLQGNFSFVVECNSLIIASVDKICSIPLFIINHNGNISISNHAPLLKEKYKLNNSNLNGCAKLEIAMSGYTIGNKTLYDEIERLESGECVLLNQGLYCRAYYYTYSPWKIVERSEEQLHKDFLNTCLGVFKKLKDSIGDRQILVPLSAGNDSRLVASCLREVGVKNVVCFSYGRKGNFETPISKAIANKLGYRWIYTRDRLRCKRQFFQSKEYQKYVDAFESFSYTPNVQEVYEVSMLKQANLVDENAIFINGSCGDFISGGHIKPTTDIKSALKTTKKINWSKFLDKHYSLWGDLRTPVNDAYIVSELENELSSRISGAVNIDRYHYSIMEHSEYNGRQSKMVMGQQRTYEYFGYEWRTPLWSDDMLNFWESVPYKYKVDQNLYLNALYASNWGCVWYGIKVNNKVINPVSLRFTRMVLKILFIPMGKARWHRFEKNVLEYFMHPSYSLTVSSYISVLFDRRGHRGTYSWLSDRVWNSKSN